MNEFNKTCPLCGGEIIPKWDSYIGERCVEFQSNCPKCHIDYKIQIPHFWSESKGHYVIESPDDAIEIWNRRINNGNS